MKMEVKIIKTIVSDGREFKPRDDVNFYLCRNDKEYECFGVIVEIGEDAFVIDNILIDRMHVSDKLAIKYSEVKNGILRFTDNGYY